MTTLLQKVSLVQMEILRRGATNVCRWADEYIQGQGQRDEASKQFVAQTRTRLEEMEHQMSDRVARVARAGRALLYEFGIAPTDPTVRIERQIVDVERRLEELKARSRETRSEQEAPSRPSRDSKEPKSRERELVTA